MLWIESSEQEKNPHACWLVQDPVGPVGTSLSPVSSALARLWSMEVYGGKSIWGTFSELTRRREPPTRWRMLTLWWPWAHSPRPIGAWGSWLPPWHHPVASPSTNQRIGPYLAIFPLLWPLKTLSWNPSGSSSVWGTGSPRLLVWRLGINATGQ